MYLPLLEVVYIQQLSLPLRQLYPQLPTTIPVLQETEVRGKVSKVAQIIRDKAGI